MFGSRALESNVNIGNGSETTIVIEKMSGGEIEMVIGRGVLEWWQDLHDRISIETGTIEKGEIGRAPIADGRIVIDPIASGNRALPGRRYHAIATAKIATGQTGNAPIAEIPIVTARTGLGSRTPPDRQYRAIETVMVGGEKIGSVLMAAPQIVSGQIECGGPNRQGRKHGRMIKVSSGPNGESGGATAVKELPCGRQGKVHLLSKGSRCVDQVIRGTTDAMGMGNRSDPVNRTTKSLVPSDPPIESAIAQSQDARSQDQQGIRARKPG